jgi:TRAP-type uncharacterized transport system fused permease subunit
MAAVRLASPLFIAPFLFVYTPILLNGPLPNVIETMVSCLVGIIAFAGMMQGYWVRKTNVFERLLLGMASICLFTPSIYTDLIGLVVLTAVTLVNRKKQEEAHDLTPENESSRAVRL